MSRTAFRKSAHISFADMQPRAEQAAAMMSAMANPKRLLVLCSLVEQERSVGELAQLVGLSDAALSQHLSKMRALNLVSARRDGQTIYYSLASGDVRAVLETLHRRFCVTD
jgi:ArsR family transcriptional regulator, virulence genes transcriptional regulator